MIEQHGCCVTESEEKIYIVQSVSCICSEIFWSNVCFFQKKFVNSLDILDGEYLCSYPAAHTQFYFYMDIDWAILT